MPSFLPVLPVLPAHPTSSKPAGKSRRLFQCFVLFSGFSALLGVSVGCGPAEPEEKSVRIPDPRTEGPFPMTHDPARLDEIGEQNCVECHAEIVNDWKRSHHAEANRPIDGNIDRSRFIPDREVVEGAETYQLFWRDDGPFLRTVVDGESSEYPLQGTIGITPLVQYLAKVEEGKWQATTAAYAPETGEWFDVFAGEGRREGEWGHWAGQGMNWNANCAYCHMTEFHKNLDPPTGAYRSTWTRQSISCVQCHAGVKDHVVTATVGNAGIPPRALTPQQVQASCATCHSRRDQLTAESFRPGDNYHDHFDLALPETPFLYYADGQIRDEVFVGGSFQMSRMGHAGISCMDCHDPHSMELTRPAETNATCTSCHDAGTGGAPIIEPLAHSHHSEGSTGNRCVECHMPKTVYMGNDPRADHGFLSPDPMMTRELGIPNACTNCHSDETVEWAEETVAEWYPDPKVLPRQRERARVLTAAWEQDPSIGKRLLALAEGEPVPAWKATYTGLMQPYSSDLQVAEYLRQSLSHPSPLVRSRAATVAGMEGIGGPRFDRLLDDPVRNVRLAAARTYVMRDLGIPDASAREEWRDYQLFNADRPQNLLFLADKAIEKGNRAAALQWLERAVRVEAANAELKRRAGILYDRLGELEKAVGLIQDAWDLEPENAGLPYSLALLRAEQQRTEETISLLRIATRLDPDFHRAWYNLSIALLQTGQFAEASKALEKGRPGISQREYGEMRAAIQRNQSAPF